MIQDKKIQLYRKALRYVNHEATSYYLRQETNLMQSVNAEDNLLTEHQLLEEKIGKIIKAKFPVSEQDKTIDLVESVSDLDVTSGLHRMKRRGLKKQVLLYPFLLLERAMTGKHILIVYETNTTFAMLRQDGVPTNWGKQGLQDDICKDDTKIIIAPDIAYNFIQNLPDIVYERQLSTMKVIAELKGFQYSWAND